jgi:PAS domain S-box-containing protein
MISVLYVDDEPSLLEIGKLFLECHGQFSVDTIISAPDALTLIKTKPYDAIISDYQMPEMDGIELLKKVRASGNTIPFILFTGRGREEVVIRALNEGADYYLQKGGEPKSQFTELMHQIRQAVQQRCAEASIRDHERREAEILNFLPYATFAIDTKGTVIAWNDAIERVTGIKGSEILGKGNYEYSLWLYHERRPMLIDLILAPEDRCEKDRYSSLIRDGTMLETEMAFETPNGTHVYVRGKASLLFDKDGNITGAIESIRNITERKQAEIELRAAHDQIAAAEEELRSQYNELARSEQAIRESEERYRGVVEDQTESICRFKPDGTHVFANDAYCALVGKTKEELIGKKFIPNIPEEDLAMTKKYLQSLTPANPRGSMTQRVIMPDGSSRWVRCNDRALFDNKGKVTEYQSVARDITEQKNAEDALLDFHRTLQYIIDFLPDAMYAIDAEGKVTVWNKAAEVLTGVPAEDMIGKSDHEYAVPFYGRRTHTLVDLILHPDAQEQSPYEHVQNTEGTTLISKSQATFHNGRTADIWIKSSPLYDYEGNISGALSVIRDVSGYKQPETALLQANRKLNLMCAVTRHDIINKIIVVCGYLKMAEMKPGDPKQAEYLEKIKSATIQILSQIEFTRVYQDLGTREPRWINLDTILPHSQVPSTITLNAPIKGVEVFADPMLEKVFFNLLDNSIRHGEHVTEIRVASQTSDEDLIVIWEDNGIGIAADEKEQIFEQGFGKNTGIGLFIVREILGIAGITIRECGEPGKGARFEIRIPEGKYRVIDGDKSGDWGN